MGKYCDNCGCELKKEARFCPNCGQKIVDVGKNAEVQEINEWQEIYQKTYKKAYAVAFQIMKNKEDAQDVLQEAYISAFKNMNSLKDKEKAGAWINQIVANRCKDWLRKKNPALFTDMGSEDNDTDYEESLLNENQEFMPEESIDYEDTKRIMQDILSALPEEQRLCILMYYYEELSVGEIAEALECSTGTVKSRLNYARKFIKTKVEELEKQGTKLYGIAPIPFIVWMLTMKENAMEVEAAEQSCWGKIEQNCERKILEHRTGSKESNRVTTNQNQNISENSQKTAGKEQNVINKVGKTGVKTGSKSVLKKIIIGTVAIAIVGTGTYIGLSKSNTEKKNPLVQHIEKEIQRKKTEKKKENIPEFTVSKEQAERILLAAKLFDNGKKTEDTTYTLGDYTLNVKKGKIETEILKKVVSGIACSDKSVGESTDDEEISDRKFLTTDECQEFLKDTFEYDANNWDEVSEVFYASGNSGADAFEARYDETERFSEKYQLKRLEQTEKNTYHFYIEVSSNDDSSVPIGIMDITAHKNEKSKIGGFVFEKIEYSEQSNIGQISHDVNLIIGNTLRVKAEAGDQKQNFNPIGIYKIDDLTNEEFIDCTNAVLSEAEYIAKDKEMKEDEMGVYDGYTLKESRYNELCKDTLGRKKKYDYKEKNDVKDKKVTFDGKFFGVEEQWFVVQDGYEVRSMDGKIKIEGTVLDYNPYNSELSKQYYSFTADAHEDSKSELGMIIDKIEVLEEVEGNIGDDITSLSSANTSIQNNSVDQNNITQSTNELFQQENTTEVDNDNYNNELEDTLTDEQYEDIKKKLGVPDDITIIETGTPYYWEAGNRTILDVIFFDNNSNCVAYACVDAKTGELVKDIYRYSE